MWERMKKVNSFVNGIKKQAETTWTHSWIIQRAINTRIFGNRVTAGSRGCYVERDTINTPHYSNIRQKFSLIHLLKSLGNHPVILHEVKHGLYTAEPRFYILAFSAMLVWSWPNAHKNNVPHILHHWKEVPIKTQKWGFSIYVFLKACT